VVDDEGKVIKDFEYKIEKNAISKETSETMKILLEAVVAEGGGVKGSVEGYRVGGKTATSQKLPRGNGKYISSFIGFAPANDPKIIGIILIDEPKGLYYGGTIAAPVMSDIFNNIFEYLNIEKG
jgi:stage V sporulation protein D (sporulation-specific penicillin-binding protein)